MATTTPHIVRHNTKRKRFQITFPEKGRTKQSFKDESDINNIVAKYQKTGAMAHVNQHGPEYGFATSHDFSSAMRLITQAQNMFNGLPSTIRNRFNNNPGEFLDFVQDANNHDEMLELGLAPKDPDQDSHETKTTLSEQEREEKTDPPPTEE